MSSSAKESPFLGKMAGMDEADEKPKPTLQPSSSSDTKQALNINSLKSPQKSLNEPSQTNEEDSFKDSEGNVVDDDDGYLDSFPPGFRFCPLDEELVLHYLKKKVMNQPLPQNRIMEVNLYRHNPEKLAEQYKQYGEKEWYFFTPREKKYRNGTRPNRAAGDGYWKATGADKPVTFKGHTIGFRKALVFYKGKPPKGDKTNWIMHEYRVNDPPPCKRVYNDMRLDDWVLCRIYEKVDKSKIRIRIKDEDSTSLSYHHHHEDDDSSNEMIQNMKFHYNNFVADSMDYSNTFGGIMHPSLLDGSAFTHNFQNQIPLIRGHEEFWSYANLDFASQLDYYGITSPYVDPLINLDNINVLSVDPHPPPPPPNKASANKSPSNFG